MRRTAILLICLLCWTSACGGADDPSGAQSPAASADPMDELAAMAWWETQTIAFGVIMEMPDPDPAVQPEAYRHLAVGTLDGRVTALLALHAEWAHSSVTGPYGDRVLVANDTGTASDVFLVSASDGSRTDLFESDGIVAAAAMGDDGASVYYVELDRQTLLDDGLWRRPLAGGAAEQVLAGPIGEPPGDGPGMYWVTADPLDARVVVQWCFGGQRCTSHLVDPATGTSTQRTEPGWPLGADETTFFGDAIAESSSAWAWNVVNDEVEPITGARGSVPVRTAGGWQFARDDFDVPEGPSVLVGPDGREHPIRGQDPPMSSIATPGQAHGVVLPPGWVLRWPMSPIFLLGEPKVPEPHGQLIEVTGGRRVDLEPWHPVVTEGADCPILVPAEMPSGQRVGGGVLQLVDGRRAIHWGSGDNRVELAVGWDGLGADVEGEPVTVRGNPARLAILRDAVALGWEEDGCSYTAWLPAGTAPKVARAYAARY